VFWLPLTPQKLCGACNQESLTIPLLQGLDQYQLEKGDLEGVPIVKPCASFFGLLMDFDLNPIADWEMSVCRSTLEAISKKKYGADWEKTMSNTVKSVASETVRRTMRYDDMQGFGTSESEYSAYDFGPHDVLEEEDYKDINSDPRIERRSSRGRVVVW
jgi:hypothetical protein